VFAIRGRGVVATGRVERGQIWAGDEVALVGLGGDRVVLLGGVERRDRAVMGDEAALLLSRVDRAEVLPGMVLAEPGSVRSHTRFRARIILDATGSAAGDGEPPSIAASAQRAELRLRSARVDASLRPTAEAGGAASDARVDVEVMLDRPVAVEPGLPFEIWVEGRRVGDGTVTGILQ
jgi:elongation factor Tu